MSEKGAEAAVEAKAEQTQEKKKEQKKYEVEIEEDREVYKDQDDLELSPGREALIEGLKDARDFKKDDTDDDEEEKKDTVPCVIADATVETRRKTQGPPRTKEEFEKQIAEEKRRLDIEFKKLWEESKSADPYRKLELDKGDGKIQVYVDNGAVINSAERKQVKYRYFIRKRKQVGEFKKYFKEFDWKAKGVVRKRFEQVCWPQLLLPPFELKDFRERLNELKEKAKALEEVCGRLPMLKQAVLDQQIKYNFLAKPRSYFKEFFQMMNADPMLQRFQIDVRRIPTFYAHRKIRQAIKDREREIKTQKDAKFRMSLTDHLLFAIICDSKRLDQVQLKLGEDAHVAVDEKVAEAIDEGEGFDWSKQESAADVERKEGGLHMVDVSGAQEKDAKNPYDRNGPFAGEQALLVHRLLRQRNLEHAFFVNESGTKDIGIFLVLIESLDYK